MKAIDRLKESISGGNANEGKGFLQSVVDAEVIVKEIPGLKLLNHLEILIPKQDLMFKLRDLLVNNGYKFKKSTSTFSKGTSNIIVDWQENEGKGIAIFYRG